MKPQQGWAADWLALRSAWRSAVDNPLLQAQRLRGRQHSASPPWWRRNLTLLVSVALALFAAGATLFPGAGGWPLSPSGNLSPGPRVLRALLVFGGVAAMSWLAQGLFEALNMACRTLARPGRRNLDLVLDPALAASRLSSAELLLGLLWPSLASLLPRVAATALFMVGAIAAGAAWDGFAPQPSAMGSLKLLLASSFDGTLAMLGSQLDAQLALWQQVLLLAPLSLLGMILSGSLASAALLLLMLLAGQRRSMEVHSGVLAALYTLGMLIFAWFTLLLSEMQRYQLSSRGPAPGNAMEQLEPWACLAWLTMMLLICLTAARAAGAGYGLVLAYGLPLAYLASMGGAIWATIAGNSGSNSFDPTHLFIDSMLSWSMFAPLSAMCLPYPACYGTGLGHLLSHPSAAHFRWLLLLLTQVLLLGGLLRLALDAVSRTREADS